MMKATASFTVSNVLLLECLLCVFAHLCPLIFPMCSQKAKHGSDSQSCFRLAVTKHTHLMFAGIKCACQQPEAQKILNCRRNDSRKPHPLHPKPSECLNIPLLPLSRHRKIQHCAPKGHSTYYGPCTTSQACPFKHEPLYPRLDVVFRDLKPENIVLDVAMP